MDMGATTIQDTGHEIHTNMGATTTTIHNTGGKAMKNTKRELNPISKNYHTQACIK